MSKAILVLDEMPNECMECELRFKDGDTDDWFRFRCHMTTDQVNKGERLENCPLKPLPQKIEELSIEETIVSNTYKSTILLEKAIKKAKQRGYNECLDEILEGEEE